MVHRQKEVDDGQYDEWNPHHDKEVVEIDLTYNCHDENTRCQEVWENFVPIYWFYLWFGVCLSRYLVLAFLFRLLHLTLMIIDSI